MSVLLLDNTYEPIRIVGWTTAMRLVFQGKAEIVEVSAQEVRSASQSWNVPSVIRQTGKWKRKGEVQFSRINIYMRDAWTCQYCAKKKAAKELTFDHVQPTSRGGKTSWTNIVTACRKCNLGKADKTPEEAKMKLLKKPEKPSWLPQQMVIRVKDIPKQWEPYVDAKSIDYWTVELEED
jgi:5-methylcytosine-specific restriction endonuclease McrA